MQRFQREGLLPEFGVGYEGDFELLSQSRSVGCNRVPDSLWNARRKPGAAERPNDEVHRGPSAILVSSFSNCVQGHRGQHKDADGPVDPASPELSG